MHTIIGILIALLAVYQIYTGRMFTARNEGTTTIVRRDEKPVYFWLALIVELVVAAVLIAGIVKL